MFRLLPTIRRCANVFVLWRTHDTDLVKAVARKIGVPGDRLLSALQHHCIGAHDSLWIDLTANSPAPFRRNGFEKILL